jgi:hypothetical protein
MVILTVVHFVSSQPPKTVVRFVSFRFVSSRFVSCSECCPGGFSVIPLVYGEWELRGLQCDPAGLR